MLITQKLTIIAFSKLLYTKEIQNKTGQSKWEGKSSYSRELFVHHHIKLVITEEVQTNT